MNSPRKLAADAVGRCMGEGAFSNLVVSSELSRGTLQGPDRSLYTALVYTTLENILTIDSIISMCSSKPLSNLHPSVLNTLRVATAQLWYMDRIPASAAVNEAVNLTAVSAKTFVNAVLRALCRERDKIDAQLSEAPDSIKYSICDSVLSLIKRQYPEEYERIALSARQRIPLALRANTLKLTREELLNAIDGSKPGKYVSTAVLIYNETAQYAASESDMYFVQGEPSQYAVELLSPMPGDLVVDVAACPGGKSVGAAIAMNNSGKILSFDIHPNKLPLITRTAARMGVDIIETGVRDGRTPAGELAGKADRVICDVPCSALGLINSKPGVRLKDAEAFASLPQLQYTMLENACEMLRPGGRVVYSTCTFNRDENEGVTSLLLSQHRDMVKISDRLFMTYRDGTEGFYVCCMEKRKDG